MCYACVLFELLLVGLARSRSHSLSITNTRIFVHVRVTGTTQWCTPSHIYTRIGALKTYIFYLLGRSVDAQFYSSFKQPKHGLAVWWCSVWLSCMSPTHTHTHTKPEPNNTYTAVANDVCVCAAHVCVKVPVSVWMEWMLYTRAWPIHMYVLALCVCCMCVCATSKCRGIQFICAYCHTIACGGAVHNRTCPSHLLNERTNGSEPLLMARLSLIVCRSFAQRFLLFYMWFHFWVLSSTSHTAAVYMLPRSCHCWLAAVVDGSVCCACSQCPFMFHSYLVILLAGRCCCCFFFYFSLFVVCWCFVCVWQIVPAVVFNAM